MQHVTKEQPGRQGDVLVQRVEALPTGLVETWRDQHGHLVAAFGERSGHRHAIREAEVSAFRFESAERDALSAEFDYILVGGAGATLNHEYVSGQKAEHEPLRLAPGVYKITGQREYSPKAIVRAVD